MKLFEIRWNKFYIEYMHWLHYISALRKRALSHHVYIVRLNVAIWSLFDQSQKIKSPGYNAQFKKMFYDN